jgi:hypothetical protein
MPAQTLMLLLVAGAFGFAVIAMLGVTLSPEAVRGNGG